MPILPRFGCAPAHDRRIISDMTNQEMLNEETDPELTQLSTPLPTLHPDLVEDFEEYKEWWETVKPKEFLEYNEENSQKVSEMDPKYVATEHDTCENTQISTGYHDFGPTPRCCWYTHGWHINTNPWQEDDYIRAAGHAPCMTCNPGGDEDIEDTECDDCYGDGFMNYYFDELVEDNDGD